MPKLSDDGNHSIYRVNVVFSGRDREKGEYFSGSAAINVKASSPSVAADWVLSYPYYAGIHRAETITVTHAYKLKRQPVWLKRVGSVFYRFDLRRIETRRSRTA